MNSSSETSSPSTRAAKCRAGCFTCASSRLTIDWSAARRMLSACCGELRDPLVTLP